MHVFKLVWKKWLAISRAIGNFQMLVIFSVFYLVFFSVLGIMFRFFVDPLKIQIKKSLQKKQTNFQTWDYREDTLIQARKQF